MKPGNQKRVFASSTVLFSFLLASTSVAQNPKPPAASPVASPTAKSSPAPKPAGTTKPAASSTQMPPPSRSPNQAASPTANPSASSTPTWNFWQTTAGNWVALAGVIIIASVGFLQWRKSNRLEREKLEWQQKSEQDKLKWEREKLLLQHELDLKKKTQEPELEKKRKAEEAEEAAKREEEANAKQALIAEECAKAYCEKLKDELCHLSISDLPNVPSSLNLESIYRDLNENRQAIKV